MDRYEPFDLKITKLTGMQWDRRNMGNLAKQFIQKQGRPRASIENRIIIVFDSSRSSSVPFLATNRRLLIKALSNVAWNPYSFTHSLGTIWCSIVLIKQGEYRDTGNYYEHPIGLGLREKDKAAFEYELLKEVSQISGGLIRYNPDYKQHGYDGDLYIDRDKICSPQAQLSFLTHIPVCNYDTPPIPNWRNCLPCPLYKDGDCLSRGAKFWKEGEICRAAE